MEPPSDSVVTGSGAGPGLGAITNDEHKPVEQGSAERVGSNLSTHNTTLAGQSVQQPTGQDARSVATASQCTSLSSRCTHQTHGPDASSPPMLVPT